MNRLFLGLLIAGGVLVVGVLVYNWWQERRARRRLEAAFSRAGPRTEGAEPTLRGSDAALGVGSSAAVAPALADADDEAEDEPALEAPVADALPPQPLSAQTLRNGIGPDADIECIVWLHPPGPVPSAALGPPAAALGKPVRWLGRRGAGLPWQAIEAASGPWEAIVACMLLADRSGAASRSDIDAFLRGAADAAARLGSRCTLPNAAEEAARAEELDRFCADLDVQIGLTILKSELGQIAGTRLRGVAEAAGFRLNAAGHFEYADETGNALWSLQNYKPEPFSVEGLRVLATPGVVLLIDVPRVAEPVRVFDQMRLVAKRLAQTLEGTLVDDNRRPLDDAALAVIRAQVHATAEALRAAHIEPGGARASRLFG